MVISRERGTTVFCEDRDPKRELWDGESVGVSRAGEWFGLDKALPIGALAAELRASVADPGKTVVLPAAPFAKHVSGKLRRDVCAR